MTTTETTPRIYVGTFRKYNEGSIKGAWLDLTDYSSKEEFYEACAELHKDETDPEFMFQDWENIPAEYVGESWLSDDFYEVMPIITALEGFTPDQFLEAYHTACRELNYGDDEIYEFDEEFFNTYFDGKPMEAARAASFGDVSWNHEYITFNGYGNLQSISKYAIESHIDKDRIIEAYKANPSEFSRLI